jgi:peptidoglycan/LPS O-acetylase OafA/YrhL
VVFKGRSIDQCIIDRRNNLDIIRFIAATLVIFSHAYPLTYGHNGSEPFALWTNGEMTFGELAVSIFFVISGFLITQSFDRSKDPIKYFKARALRIFPGLLFCLLLASFLLGPIMTELSLKEYFTDRDTYEYLITLSLYYIQYDLPGIFESNIWPAAVNGSLWTLWYEFFFYIVVAVMGVIRLLNRRVVLASFLLVTGLYFLGKGGFYTDLFRYFSAGMVFYLYRKHIRMNGLAAIVSLIILLLTVKFGNFEYALSIFGTYLIFYIAFDTRLKLHNFGKYGDFSYGIYIYAFPIQQVMTYLFPGQLSPAGNFLLTFPVTLMFAILSWYLIEKRALKYKNHSFTSLFRKRKLYVENYMNKKANL